MNALAEDNKLSIESLSALEELVRERQLQPIVITGHTGWSDDLDFVFAHTDCVCHATKKQKPHDPDAPYDESDDTKESAQTVRLQKKQSLINIIQELICHPK